MTPLWCKKQPQEERKQEDIEEEDTEEGENIITGHGYTFGGKTIDMKRKEVMLGNILSWKHFEAKSQMKKAIDKMLILRATGIFMLVI